MGSNPTASAPEVRKPAPDQLRRSGAVPVPALHWRPWFPAAHRWTGHGWGTATNTLGVPPTAFSFDGFARVVPECGTSGVVAKRAARLDRPMKSLEVELFTDGGNDAVLRLPGRRFPGVLLQGDSLSVLRADVSELADLCNAGDLEEARQAAALLLADMDALMERYTEVLRLHAMQPPF